jgi:hypothetical protein
MSLIVKISTMTLTNICLIVTLSIVTLRIMDLIVTLSIMVLIEILSIRHTQNNGFNL